MITRIVKMEFQESGIPQFLEIFKEVKEKIKGFEGCLDLKLMHNGHNIYFTISQWKDEQYLENYRNSELFIKTWTETKKHFSAKAEAWTTYEVEINRT